jgi:hypothetical protein
MPSDSQLRIDPGSSATFKDLTKGDPAFVYAQALANAGYSVGYEDGTFKPNQPITREEMIVMKVAVDGGKDVPASESEYYGGVGLTDKDVNPKYKGAIYADEHYRGGLGNNRERAFGKARTFRPKQAVCRNEAAAALWQFGQYDMYTAGKVLGDKAHVILPKKSD